MLTCISHYKTRGLRDLAKVDLLYSTHALRKRGLFETVEMKMKEVTARHLSVGSRVTWDNNPKDAGTVIETGFNACKVKWDDPSNGDVSLLHFTEMANIGLAKPTGKPRLGEAWENVSLAEVGI